MELKKKEWDDSYKNKDNFIFYPHEEIVRFISKHIYKRVGFNNFIKQHNIDYTPKVLDCGCGIGRHVKLLDEFGIDAYGFDLSTQAIMGAIDVFRMQNLDHLKSKVIDADITKLPYEDGMFDFMLSHGVLDSMPYEIAKKGLIKLHRCLSNKGLIYFDVISRNDDTFQGKVEKEVKDAHEYNTIQTFFDEKMIYGLIDKLFKIKELYLIDKKDLMSGISYDRYHIIIEKI